MKLSGILRSIILLGVRFRTQTTVILSIIFLVTNPLLNVSRAQEWRKFCIDVYVLGTSRQNGDIIAGKYTTGETRAMGGFPVEEEIRVPSGKFDTNGLAELSDEDKFPGASELRRSIERTFNGVNEASKACKIWFKINKIYIIDPAKASVPGGGRLEEWLGPKNEDGIRPLNGDGTVRGKTTLNAFSDYVRGAGGTNSCLKMLLGPFDGSGDRGRAQVAGDHSIVDIDAFKDWKQHGLVPLHELLHNLGIRDHTEGKQAYPGYEGDERAGVSVDAMAGSFKVGPTGNELKPRINENNCKAVREHIGKRGGNLATPTDEAPPEPPPTVETPAKPPAEKAEKGGEEQTTEQAGACPPGEGVDLVPIENLPHPSPSDGLSKETLEEIAKGLDGLVNNWIDALPAVPKSCCGLRNVDRLIEHCDKMIEAVLKYDEDAAKNLTDRLVSQEGVEEAQILRNIWRTTSRKFRDSAYKRKKELKAYKRAAEKKAKEGGECKVGLYTPGDSFPKKEEQEYAFAFAVQEYEECVATTYYAGSAVITEGSITGYQFGQPIYTTIAPETSPTSEGDIPACPTTAPPRTVTAPEPKVSAPPPATTAVTKTPPSTVVPEEEKVPQEKIDLGLAKAEEALVTLVLKGEDPGQDVSQAKIKLVEAAPEIPTADAEPDPKLTSVENYAADMPGGSVNRRGEVAIALTDEAGSADNPQLIELSAGEPTATERTKRVIRQPVKIPRERMAQLVVTGKEPVTATKSVPGLPAKLVPKKARICVARTFRIGKTPVYVVRLPKQLIDQFTRKVEQTGTYYVEPDPCTHKEELNDPYYNSSGLWGQKFDNQWAIKRVGFDAAKSKSWPPDVRKLSPITVAVIDSGVDWYHPDFPRQALWRNTGEIPNNGIDDDHNGYVDDVIGWNFIDNNRLPWDHDGHGTFVSGVIAAGQNNGIGIAGINPAARIMVLKALDAFGRGYASQVAEAITYAVDNGARVINLSLGGQGPTRFAQLAIDYARAKGVIVVVAAGNEGKEASNYTPAGLKGVVTVTATDRRDKRAGFSNWGPLVDIAAPGIDVLSLRARKTDLLSLIRGVKYKKGQGIVGKDRAYFRASGTSFAAPMVSGTLSLILAANPTLTGRQATRMVLQSARDIETPGFDNYTGYGLLDAAAALKADPAFFVESRITGIRLVRRADKPYLRIIGTSDANQFAEAVIQIGRGATPTKWLQVDRKIKAAVSNAKLMDLPASFFVRAKTWTIRLITRHKNGSQREARFKLTLG